MQPKQCRKQTPMNRSKHWDLLCLPPWLLLILAAKCDGDACPFMCGFFSEMEGAGIIMTEGERKKTSEAQRWPAVLPHGQQRDTFPELCAGQFCDKRIVLRSAKQFHAEGKLQQYVGEGTVLDARASPHMLNVRREALVLIAAELVLQLQPAYCIYDRAPLKYKFWGCKVL